MPDGSPAPARVPHGPRVGFGAATAALVVLATGGTGLLVAHGTRQLQPTAPQAVPPVAATPPALPVLVDRPPGSLTLPSPHVDGTARAIHRALASAPRRTRRTITAPLTPAAPPEVVVVPPAAPPAATPPPAVAPPPVVEPADKPGHGKPHPAHPDDKGKHLGQLKH